MSGHFGEKVRRSIRVKNLYRTYEALQDPDGTWSMALVGVM